MTHELIHIGLYVIFGVVLLPVYVMFVGWFVGHPREYRPVAIALGYMVVFFTGIALGVVVLDVILGFIISA